MNLLVLTEDFYPSVSGGAHARWRFAQIATQRGHNVTVVTPRQPNTPKAETVDGVEIVRPFPAKPSPLPPASLIATGTRIFHSGAVFAWLQWWARNRQFDAVYSVETLQHIHHDHEWVFDEVARITDDLLVTVEVEPDDGDAEPAVNYVRDAFPLYRRDWHAVFTSLGLEETASIQVDRGTLRAFRRTGAES
jgi:hypothetical protein